MVGRGRSWILIAALLSVIAMPGAAVAESPLFVVSIAIEGGWGQALSPDGGVVVVGTGNGGFVATPGAWDESPDNPERPDNDAFVQKLDATGRTVWASWIGASGADNGQNVTVGDDGSVYVAGYSSWGTVADFPTTPDALSADYTAPGAVSGEVAWLLKFTDGGELVWSTLVPGVRYVNDLAVDGDGRLHITGEAYDDFPVTPGAFDTVHAGTSEGFVATVDAAGSTLEAASFLGGSDGDTSHEIALAADGSVYVAAQTQSVDAPTTDGAFDRTHAGGHDALVARVASDGETLMWSTYLGGTVGGEAANEYVEGLTVDGHGGPVVAGVGAASDFPTTPEAPYPSPPGSDETSWVTRLSEDGTGLAWSTFVPAVVREPHLDQRGHTRLVGLAPTAEFAGDGGQAWTVLIDLDLEGQVDRVTPIADQMAYDYDVDPPGSSYILSAPAPEAPLRARATATAADATLTRIPQCTIRGTAGPDELTGTPIPDVICAGGGDDVVNSGAGYDVILLGRGNDRAWSGAGVDVVDGGSGGDLLVGRAARDLLMGGRGPDTLRGGDGPDSLLGNEGSDRLYGGAGRDELKGGVGIDRLVR